MLEHYWQRKTFASEMKGAPRERGYFLSKKGHSWEKGTIQSNTQDNKERICKWLNTQKENHIFLKFLCQDENIFDLNPVFS